VDNTRYTTRRLAITEALVEKLKSINGVAPFNTDLGGNVVGRIQFPDEVNEYPAVNVTAGRETREYLPGQFKNRYLSVTVRCYVNNDDSVAQLEGLLADIEFVVEENGRLAYQTRSGAPGTTHDIRIVSIDTDEGVLTPLGVGEILLQVLY
jgi:hypothetical protein